MNGKEKLEKYLKASVTIDEFEDVFDHMAEHFLGSRASFDGALHVSSSNPDICSMRCDYTTMGETDTDWYDIPREAIELYLNGDIKESKEVYDDFLAERKRKQEELKAKEEYRRKTREAHNLELSELHSYLKLKFKHEKDFADSFKPLSDSAFEDVLDKKFYIKDKNGKIDIAYAWKNHEGKKFVFTSNKDPFEAPQGIPYYDFVEWAPIPGVTFKVEPVKTYEDVCRREG